jgi:uncharacterized protein
VKQNDSIEIILPKVMKEIRQTLIDDESRYQRESANAEFSSLWIHSMRVGQIASLLAVKEGLDPKAAFLAGLLHDSGKFAGGKYHEDDVAEETAAVDIAKRLLEDTPYSELVPVINDAIISLYREDLEASEIGKVVYDADRLDKLGYMGVAQFFTKNALRRNFLDNDLLLRASIELTYAHHAPETLKTESGRDLALVRSARVRSFYWGLLEEWEELDLGSFSIWEESIEGIVCVLVMPDSCECGLRLNVDADIKDSVKCRSAVVQYSCGRCGIKNEFSFCMPNVKELPPVREDLDS